MAAPPPAQDVATTTTVVLDPRSQASESTGLAIDAEGSIFYTVDSAKCVYKSRRRGSRHVRPVVLAGDPEEGGEADGEADSARFGIPGDVCINPLDRGLCWSWTAAGCGPWTRRQGT